MTNMNWKVIATCYAKNGGMEHIEEFERVIAQFENPWLAQDFIEKCFPIEDKDKFRVERI